MTKSSGYITLKADDFVIRVHYSQS